ncbi:MAG: hypothetical protein GX443_09725 [Deltaproteobacteria bacterium]|nr:hypothetical protein [Deltaproteobacteria bacterium]
MRLSLIGMSGSGKSHWSLKLSQAGFRRFCCDELIAARLSGDLRNHDGSLRDLGEWMGFPFEPGYAERESKYLQCETEVIEEILTYLWSLDRTRDEKVVVDTTGSVIYTGDALLAALKAQTTVVHLETPSHVRLDMLESYVRKPRPVLWRGFFKKQKGETEASALARCYVELLERREALYAKAAHLTIPFHEHKSEVQGIEGFLKRVCQLERC